MPDLYTLFAKIQSLPKRRIAEVEDFVDFLTLRRGGKVGTPPVTLEEKMERLETDGRRVRTSSPAAVVNPE
jgi:hypothetical protein